MRASAPILVFGLALGGAGEVVADKLHLKGGGVLEGHVTAEGDRYRVLLPSGAEAVIPAADVEKVTEGETYRDDYIRRLNRLDPTDADGHYLLGLFCLDYGLKQEAEWLFRHVVRLLPDHAGARAALGEVVFEGEWVAQEEAYRRQGLVKHASKWVTPDEKRGLELADRRREWSETIRRLGVRLRSTSPETRAEAARAMAAIDDPAALEPLLEAAEHWHPDVRVATPPALARFAPRFSAAVAALARLACRDAEVRVQDAAIAAMGAARLVPVAEELLDRYIEADDAAVRKAAAHALGKLRFKPAFDALVSTLWFTVLRNRLVPAAGIGALYAPPPQERNPPLNARRRVLRSYRLQRYDYRVVEDVAFNDAARTALGDLCGVDYDFDRTGWRRWWSENEARLDIWMRPVEAEGR